MSEDSSGNRYPGISVMSSAGPRYPGTGAMCSAGRRYPGISAMSSAGLRYPGNKRQVSHKTPVSGKSLQVYCEATVSGTLYCRFRLYKIRMDYKRRGSWVLQIKVGELIRAKREEYNISLVDFARQVDISPGYLSQLENGKKTNPSLEVMLKIAQELDLDIDSLLGLDQESETPALRIPSLLRLVIAKDRNLKALEDREIQRKISNLLDRILQSKYLIEDSELYGLFLEDLYVQTETTLKRYMSMEILKNMGRA